MVARGDRLIRRHQGAVRHGGFADAAGDGRGDAGVSQIDAGRLHRRLPVLDVGLGLFQGGVRIVEVLLADRFGGKQFAKTLRP